MGRLCNFFTFIFTPTFTIFTLVVLFLIDVTIKMWKERKPTCILKKCTWKWKRNSYIIAPLNSRIQIIYKISSEFKELKTSKEFQKIRKTSTGFQRKTWLKTKFKILQFRKFQEFNKFREFKVIQKMQKNIVKKIWKLVYGIFVTLKIFAIGYQ